jgi:uncharacterized protein (UPF0332 family)
MKLNEEEKDIVVQHRLKRANETLAETKDLLNLNRWHGAANRLYYACYYAVTALLIKHGHMSHTHGGAKGLLGKYFVSTNIVSKEQNKLYEKLFDLRQNSDYSDWISIEEIDIKPLLEPAEKFIVSIENLIKETDL